MKPPTPRHGRITVNIERLIVPEELLGTRRTSGLQKAVEQELAALLEQSASHEFAAKTAPLAKAPEISVRAGSGAQELGRQIAHSVFASILRPL